MMADTREELIIEFEAARNEAIDKYFDARHWMVRTASSERCFEAGFRMAWALKNEDDQGK